MTLHAGEAQQPVADVVGALDPNQADILSAYSTEQGRSSSLLHGSDMLIRRFLVGADLLQHCLLWRISRGCNGSAESAYWRHAGFKEVDVHYLAYNMQDNPEVDIIDVRTPEEYASGHIAGTTNVSLDSLSEAVRNGSLTPGKAMAVVCARGGRSAQACVRLTKVFGFPDVTNVTGGMQAWTAADLPVVRD